MKIPDANLLLDAVNEDAAPHEQAKAWLQGVLSGSEPVGFEWSVLNAFLRLSTRAGVFPRPLSLDEAFESLALWLDPPCAQIVDPAEKRQRAGGPRVREKWRNPSGSVGVLPVRRGRRG